MELHSITSINIHTIEKAVPDSTVIAEKETRDAASRMVDVWKAEQRHEDDPIMIGVSESDNPRFKKIGKP